MNLLILLALGQCNETLRNVRQVVSGPMHACALRADGSVWCWGDNGACQLRANVSYSSTAVATPYVSYPLARTPTSFSRYTNVRSLAAFGNVTCALRLGGDGVCWGSLHQNMASCLDREWVLQDITGFAAVHGGIVAHRDGLVRVTGRSTGPLLPAVVPRCYVEYVFVALTALTPFTGTTVSCAVAAP